MYLDPMFPQTFLAPAPEATHAAGLDPFDFSDEGLRRFQEARRAGSLGFREIARHREAFVEHLTSKRQGATSHAPASVGSQPKSPPALSKPAARQPAAPAKVDRLPQLQAEWRELVRSYVDKGMSCDQAMKAAARANPLLRQRLIAAANKR